MPTSDLAFSDVLPIISLPPKPRDVALTEVRTAARSLIDIRGYTDTLSPYLDSVKWTVGTQRLLSRRQVSEINAHLHEHQIEVSSGGLIEAVMPLGAKAVHRYLEQSKELGFDIIEISSAMVAISIEDKCRIVTEVLAAGLKPKPEITAWTPGDRGTISAEKALREAEAVLSAGAWKVMIEEDGIFSTANSGNPADEWNRDVAWRLASRIPQEYLFWEASSLEIILWLINSFGPDVNLFGGDEHLGYIASFRAGAFLTNTATMRD
ncbi:phosphosulfolactate synthase [Mycobacterium terramassiliense]|uniref:Phosphosulfolactate synthase, CoM biosynthesis protein A n=1 Tax=Mycobacterium terramassiliense TaxID=1841859 RepID=A0A2U3NGS5_9MYCO|nr:phosphosulfolactate synthase [Mycobacterium terramassiliense]SPM30625.1 Phosphosulfolactate synthase, CoM biosynthesis protein A [Mycobacterium terramassiliense]